MRLVRDAAGKVIDVRDAASDYWQTTWLRDPAVAAFFRAKDLAWDRAHGFLGGDDQEQAGEPAEVTR